MSAKNRFDRAVEILDTVGATDASSFARLNRDGWLRQHGIAAAKDEKLTNAGGDRGKYRAGNLFPPCLSVDKSTKAAYKASVDCFAGAWQIAQNS